MLSLLMRILFLHVLCVLAALLLNAASAASAADAAYQIAIDLSSPATLATGTFEGRITISTWEPERSDAGYCLYLPFDDPNFELDPARGVSPTVVKYGRAERQSGSIELLSSTVPMPRAWRGQHILRFDRFPSGGMTLTFRTRLPRWPDRTNKALLIDQFYPEPLARCPVAAEAAGASAFASSLIDVDLVLPDAWTLVSPGIASSSSPGTQHITFVGPRLPIYVAPALRTISRKADGLPEIILAHESPEFAELLPFAERFLRTLARVLGPYPYARVVIVETADLEKARIPGLIALNRPRQYRADEIQARRLNWTVWQLAYFLAEQWLMVAVVPTTYDDYWVHRGNTDFAASLALREDQRAHDFFAPVGGKPARFHFDYRQTQDLIAAALTYLKPHNALTTPDLTTKTSYADQHPFAYIRHSLLLRYLHWHMGAERSEALWRDYFTTYRGQRVTPRAFFDFVTAHVEGVAPVIRQWWSHDSWPDVELLDVTEQPTGEGSANAVTVWVGQNPDLEIPVDVAITDAHAQTHIARTVSHNGRWLARATIAGNVRRVVLNPGHELYDRDRFDNTDDGVKFNVFPGPATTFPDDAYSVLWLPAAGRLPGEDFTWLIMTQVFKYVHSAFTGIVSYAPRSGRTGLSALYVASVPALGTYAVVNLNQDFSATSRGERVVDGALYRAIPFVPAHAFEVGARIKNRQVLGQPESSHQTVAIRTTFQPLARGRCNYLLRSDFETTVPIANHEIRYRRDSGIAEGTCRAFGLDVEVRAFRGVSYDRRNAPDTALINPQAVDEARLRIDQPALASVSALSTYGVDLLGPLPLPWEAGIILPRETRWRIFYDHGIASGHPDPYRAAGLGIYLPFGFDVVGKQSMSFLRLSLLTVLYRSYDGQSDTTPGLLFDILGKL